MEVSSKPHTPATLPQEKNPGNHRLGGLVGTADPVLKFWRREKSSTGIRASSPPVRSVIAIPTTLPDSLPVTAKGEISYYYYYYVYAVYFKASSRTAIIQRRLIWCFASCELERMWKEAVTTELQVLTRYLLEANEENNGPSQTNWSLVRLRAPDVLRTFERIKVIILAWSVLYCLMWLHVFWFTDGTKVSILNLQKCTALRGVAASENRNPQIQVMKQVP
jgi:hypothetical protein